MINYNQTKGKDAGGRKVENMEKLYKVRDWDGSVIFDKATLSEISEYFHFENIEDIIDLQEALKTEYDGMKCPEITEIN